MNNFLKTVMKYGKKVEKLKRINYESKLTYDYDDKCIKTKIKTYADIIITNFHNYIDEELDSNSDNDE